MGSARSAKESTSTVPTRCSSWSAAMLMVDVGLTQVVPGGASRSARKKSIWSPTATASVSSMNSSTLVPSRTTSPAARIFWVMAWPLTCVLLRLPRSESNHRPSLCRVRWACSREISSSTSTMSQPAARPRLIFSSFSSMVWSCPASSMNLNCAIAEILQLGRLDGRPIRPLDIRLAESRVFGDRRTSSLPKAPGGPLPAIRLTSCHGLVGFSYQINPRLARSSQVTTSASPSPSTSSNCARSNLLPAGPLISCACHSGSVADRR